MRRTPREVFLCKKDKFVLNDEQKSVLIGTILGDGNLRYRGNDCRLHIKHSLKQLSLVRYKRRIFDPITSMKVRIFSQRVGKQDYSFAEFVTLTHPVFSFYYHLFYQNGKKIVTKEIVDFLDPLMLAVWIMDDGSAEYAGLSIQTHSFSEVEVGLLAEALENKFNIRVMVRKNKGKYVLYFPFASMFLLVNKIGKYILPDFRYKLIPYREKPRRDCTPDSDVSRNMIQSDPTGNSRSLIEISSRLTKT